MRALDSAPCPREAEVADTVRAGRVFGHVGADLRAHLQTCSSCAGVAALTAALCRDQQAAASRVPPAAYVWWRAQVRARQEAVEVVARPMTVVQSVTAAGALGLAAAAIGFGWPSGATAVASTAASLARVAATILLDAAGLVARVPYPAFVLGVIGAALILMPVAAYLALGEE